jgi:hypothetical protein
MLRALPSLMRRASEISRLEQPLRHQLRHLILTRREAGQGLGIRVRETVQHARVQHGGLRHEGAKPLRHAGGGGGFQQVAGRAGLEGLADTLIVLKGGEDHHPDGRPAASDFSRRLDAEHGGRPLPY